MIVGGEEMYSVRLTVFLILVKLAKPTGSTITPGRMGTHRGWTMVVHPSNLLCCIVLHCVGVMAWISILTDGAVVGHVEGDDVGLSVYTGQTSMRDGRGDG
jgi:hypothetical protein